MNDIGRKRWKDVHQNWIWSAKSRWTSYNTRVVLSQRIIRIARERSVQQKKSPLTFSLKKRLTRCLVGSVALYETRGLRKEDQRRLKVFRMWVWRRMEGIRGQDRLSWSLSWYPLCLTWKTVIKIRYLEKCKRNWGLLWLRNETE